MNLKEYQNKVRGCWLGKNVGGSLGAPFECRRGVFDVDFYTHDISKGVLPNDDLDLQLVFLNAAEKYGRELDSTILGEYWLSHIVANWSEYGAAKNNMAMGILPPFSGEYNNHNKNSNGCFIRSEIWACLMPGQPQLAVKYAYEDAIVDHADEGVYAELFCTALESAAFCESDINELINIGLSYIPKDCDIALAVHTALESYRTGADWKSARKAILKTVPGSFGMYLGYENRAPEQDVPVGTYGYDAPSNIGLMVLGLLYGEGDFSKSICIAVNCGEDADCTAATIGSILGIIMGADNIPQKWLEPIGDEIKNISIDVSDSEMRAPTTITELTERVCRLMPVFMVKNCDILQENGVELIMADKKKLYCEARKMSELGKTLVGDKFDRVPCGIRKRNSIVEAILEVEGGINIKMGEEKVFILNLENRLRKQQWLTVKWYMPDDWTVLEGNSSCINLDQAHGGVPYGEKKYTIVPGELNKEKYELLVEIKSNGRISPLYIPIVLFV